MKDKLRQTLDANLARVESLVSSYESHPDARGRGRKDTAVLDILRAAVVLLHASLEDLLRGIAEWKLPSASKEVLDEIPIVGRDSATKKLTLGDFVVHRGKTVDTVFEESVESYLQRSNYNNTDDIAKVLGSVDIDVSKVNSRFSDLQVMMLRRHQIVHRADRKAKVSGSGDHAVSAINKHLVRSWATAVREFGIAVLAEV